jgi:hypothetical protein
MSEESFLRRKARDLIEAGIQPSRDRVSGGPGSGAQCAVCGEPVRLGELQVDIEFAGNGQGKQTHAVHMDCFSILVDLDLNNPGMVSEAHFQKPPIAD